MDSRVFISSKGIHQKLNFHGEKSSLLCSPFSGRLSLVFTNNATKLPLLVAFYINNTAREILNKIPRKTKAPLHQSECDDISHSCSGGGGRSDKKACCFDWKEGIFGAWWSSVLDA